MGAKITKVRKKLRTIEELEDGEKYTLLTTYINSPMLKTEDLAKQFNVAPKTLTKYIERLYTNFTQVKETKALIRQQQLHQNQSSALKELRTSSTFKHPKCINEEFLSLLEQYSEECNETEHIYAYVYTFTGDNHRALKESGLLVGLKPASSSFKSNCLMRGYYLRTIPRIKTAIRLLRDTKLNDMGIDKPMVQSEIISLLDSLKEQGDNRTLNQRIKLIELLAKTVGALQENIKVENIDPDKALDTLVAKARAAEISMLPAGSKTEEVWEVED